MPEDVTFDSDSPLADSSEEKEKQSTIWQSLRDSLFTILFVMVCFLFNPAACHTACDPFLSLDSVCCSGQGCFLFFNCVIDTNVSGFTAACKLCVLCALQLLGSDGGCLLQSPGTEQDAEK